MHSFETLTGIFIEKFKTRHFPQDPETLYGPAEYFLGIGGKRIRPVLCLMGNELFGDITDDAYHAATAIELFHNFTLVHDDIMDNAPIRRGMPTVHAKHGSSTALLAGDVMLVGAYEALNKIHTPYLHAILHIFNQTASAVCEGQQLDMDFEKQEIVSMDAYIRMIGLKTAVLLAASLRMGAILGGAGEGNQQHLYAFGKNLGLAFQMQDDYLDAFGDPAKFGKQPGGDIIANKKTFLYIRTLEMCNEAQQKSLLELTKGKSPSKIDDVIALYKACGTDAWALETKNEYMKEAMRHLDEIAVQSSRKKMLESLAQFLVQRDY